MHAGHGHCMSALAMCCMHTNRLIDFILYGYTQVNFGASVVILIHCQLAYQCSRKHTNKVSQVYHGRRCTYNEVKGKFLFCAVSSPQNCSTHYFSGRLIQSHTISTSLGSMQSCFNLCVKTARIDHVPLSTARYSFIQLSELKQHRVKNFTKVWHRSTGFEPRVLLVASLKLYPLSHCALWWTYNGHTMHQS